MFRAENNPAFQNMSFYYLTSVSKFSCSLVSGQRAHSVSFFPRRLDDKSCNPPRAVKPRSSRRRGELFRRCLARQIFEYELFEISTPEFQCQADCPLGFEDAKVEIPHSEVAFQEAFQTHFSQSRACHSLYQRVISLLPRQFNGFLAKRIFAQKYARLLNENFVSNVENVCNEQLFMTPFEVEVVRSRAVQNSALLSRSVAMDVLFDAFVAASRMAYASAIAGHFSFSDSMSEDFHDFFFSNLGASSCSFNVEALPGVFQPIVTELYLAGTISANLVSWFATHSGLSIPGETLDLLDNMLERWKTIYTEYLAERVQFQTRLPGAMPEEELPTQEQVRILPALVSGVTSVFSRVGKSVVNAEQTLQNVNDMTLNLSGLSQNMSSDYASMKTTLDQFITMLTPSQGTQDVIRVIATRVAPLVLLIIGFLRYRGFIISCLKYVAIAAMTYYGGAAAMSFIAFFHRVYARELGMEVASRLRPGDLGSHESDFAQEFQDEGPDSGLFPDQAEFQSGNDFKDFIELARPILNLKRFDSDDPLDSLMEVLSDSNPWASDANKVLFITSRLSELWTKIVKLTGWYKPEYEKFCSGYPDIDSFCTEALNYVGAEDLIPTRSTLASVERLYNLSAALRVKYEKNHAATRIIQEIMPKLQKLMLELRKLNFDSKSYRVEPVNLMLRSDPGLGKTTAFEIINDRLVRYTLKDNKEALELFRSRPKEYLYSRNTSKYWEGASNHVALVYYADYMAGKAEVTGCSHEAELMDLIGCQQFSPDMAFDLKGRIDIRPAFVTMGTNEASIAGEGARHKGAVARRLNPYKLIWVGPGHGPTPGMKINETYWRFRPQRFNSVFAFEDDSTKKDLTLDEVVAITIIRREMLIRKMSALRESIVKVDSVTDNKLKSVLSSFDFKEGMTEFDVLESVFQSGPLWEEFFSHDLKFVGREKSSEDLRKMLKSASDVSCYVANQHDVIFKVNVMYAFRVLATEQNITMYHAGNQFEEHWTDGDMEFFFRAFRNELALQNTSSTFKAVAREVSLYSGVLFTLIKDLVVDNTVVVATTLITLISYFALTSDLGQTKSDEAPVPETQGKTYVDQSSLSKQKSKKLKKVQKLQLKRIEAQSGTQVPVAITKAKYHTFSLRASGVHFQNIIALEDRVFFVNNHCFERLKNLVKEIGDPEADFEFEAVNVERGINFKILYSEMVKGINDEHSDLMFFVAPGAPQSSSILRHWVDDHFILDKMDAISGNVGLGAYLPSQTGPQFFADARIINGKSARGPDGENRFVRQLWRCVLISETGDCGSLYFATSNNGGCAGKFIGFHAMGYPGHGPAYACAVTKSTIQAAIDKLLERDVKPDFAGRDVIGDGKRVHFNKTKIQEVLVPLIRPYEPKLANVQCNDRDVYVKAVSKYNKTQRLSPLLRSQLKESVEAYLTHCEKVQTIPMNRGLLDLEQAIVGKPGTSLDSIDLSTSPGYPYNCTADGLKPATKHALVGKFENGVFVPGPLADVTQGEVENCIASLAIGEIPMWVYTDVIKSETLPKEKVAQGKGRLVSAAPNSLVLVTRMLFGNFMMWMKDNYLSNGHSVENTEGVDAHILTEQHLTVAALLDLHMAGDLSAYDTRHSIDALEVVLECIIDFILRHNPDFDDATKAVFRTYIKSMSFTYHIRGSTIHRWVGSLASGHPLTTIVNSVLNHAYFAYSVWKKTDFRPRFWDWYFANVMVRVLGDDNRASCSPEAAPFVSEEVCASGYADFGHVYTDDLKSGNISSDFRPFNKTTILKRFCRFEPALAKYVWPLRIEVIEELPLWTRAEGSDAQPSMEQALLNVNTAVKHLSYHDDSEWARLIPQWEQMYAELGWKCPYANRVQCLKSVFGDEFTV